MHDIHKNQPLYVVLLIAVERPLLLDAALSLWVWWLHSEVTAAAFMNVACYRIDTYAYISPVAL